MKWNFENFGQYFHELENNNLSFPCNNFVKAKIPLETNYKTLWFEKILEWLWIWSKPVVVSSLIIIITIIINWWWSRIKRLKVFGRLGRTGATTTSMWLFASHQTVEHYHFLWTWIHNCWLLVPCSLGICLWYRSRCVNGSCTIFWIILISALMARLVRGRHFVSCDMQKRCSSSKTQRIASSIK